MNPTAITKPGVYDMPEDVYHADPVAAGSLSKSGAKELLPPSCPAKFLYQRLNGRPPKTEFDFGHAAHCLLLGKGADIEIIQKTDRKTGEVTDAVDRRTDSAKEHEAAIRAAGKVPMLAKDMEQARAMVAALRQHPVAAALFDLDRGEPEQSLFWLDGGLWRRARFDSPVVPLVTANGIEVYADYKTTDNASPSKLDRQMADFGYIQQAPWYIDGAQALDLCGPDAEFLFVFQERTPPYLVSIARPDPMAVRIGRARNQRAMDIYQQCVETGVWPGYSDEIIDVGVPRWVENQFLEEYV